MDYSNEDIEDMQMRFYRQGWMEGFSEGKIQSMISISHISTEEHEQKRFKKEPQINNQTWEKIIEDM